MTPKRPPRPDRSRGVEMMKEVYGFTGDAEVGPGDFLAYTVDHLFGDVWCRPGLDVASRRLLTIGVLAAQGQEDLVDLQFAAALDRQELTEEQVRELVIHLTHYVGWPLGARLNNSAERVIARRAQSPSAQSPSAQSPSAQSPSAQP